jgi:uncharacterized protein (TIGR02301 family)
VKPAFVALVSAIAAIAVSGQTLAAETPAAKNAPASASPAPAPAEAPLPPYEPQLLRLAEIMGSLAYLRDLCGAADGAKFRAKVVALIDAEGASETRRDQLAGAYNRGFRDYQTTYRACTPAAEEVVSRFLSEAERLAAQIVNRHGG